MVRLDLVEFVLLECRFSPASPGRPAEAEPSGRDVSHGEYSEPERFLTLELADLSLAYGARREEHQFRLVVEAALPDTPPRELKLSVMAGARFATDAPVELTAEIAEPTLLFIAYPYLRELVFDLTGRSLIGPIRLAPITKLPAPSLWDVIEQPGTSAGSESTE